MLANLLSDFGHKLNCARKWSLPVATPSLKNLKPFDAGDVIGLGDGIEYLSRTLADGYDKGGKKQAVLLSCVRLPATAEHGYGRLTVGTPLQQIQIRDRVKVTTSSWILPGAMRLKPILVKAQFLETSVNLGQVPVQRYQQPRRDRRHEVCATS